MISLWADAYDETHFILTGYELRSGKIIPLDKVSSGHPINVYNGSDEELFLKDLISALRLTNI